MSRQQKRHRHEGIPPISDYAHWNEEAETVWYLENRYDMEYPPEDDPDDWYDDDYDEYEDDEDEDGR